MKLVTCVSLYCMLYGFANACMTTTSSAGIVMNDGEYSNFERMEHLGQNGLNFIRENIPVPGQTTTDSIIIRDIISGKAKHLASPLTAVLISSSFRYDPDADSSFLPERQFAFNNDTLTIHDYWTLVDQPAFDCSLSVLNDTLHLTYTPATGPVNDWTPSVETTLKIKLQTSQRTIVCCFDAVKNHARAPRPEETGFGDAKINRYAALPIPPLTAYKYRAHSYPTAMVFLDYHKNGLYRLSSPRITVTFDSMSMLMDSTPFAGVLLEELKWLAAEGICAPAPATLARLTSMGSGMSGGWCYWTRQDSAVALNQWFEISREGVYTVYSTRGTKGGCGLGTNFSLPSEKLAVIGTNPTYHASSVSSRLTARILNGNFAVSSSMPFDKLTIYNLSGREILDVKFAAPMNNTPVPLARNGILPGNYIVVISSADRRIDCRPLLFR